MKKLLILILSLMATAVFAQQDIPLEAFSKGSEFSSVKISPNGEYLGFITKAEGKSILGFLELDGFKVIHAVRFNGNAQVGRYEWVNDNRVVLEKEYIRGWRDHPEYHGELFGVNVDGSRGRYLVGYQGEIQTGSRLKKATPLYGTSYILDPLVNDEDKMLIVTYPWSGSKEPVTVVYEVNVHSGVRRKVSISPRRMGRFLTDHQGEVRAVASTDDNGNTSVFIKNTKDSDWKELTLAQDLDDYWLHGFDESGKLAYLSAAKAGEPRGVYQLTLETGKLKHFFQDKLVDPSKIWRDPVNQTPFAIELDPDYPTYAFVDQDSIWSQRLKSLIASIPGNQIRIVSGTRDGSRVIVFAGSDINPGNYYLFDSKKNQLGLLVANRSWIDPNSMSTMEAISFKGRDGITIHGYLTTPQGKEKKNLPLIVMPHGGPHGPRDYWQFDPEVQMLASRGMAVLQINFRGSGGYGDAFEELGYRKWGKEIQYDIIDGTRDLISKGIADKNRICIMGASFGGYSALQSAILEPDLFQCAVGVVGVYDLPLMFEEGDIAQRSSGVAYLERVLGTDEKQLKEFSPSYNVEKLKVPVLIVHGGEDQRAPIEQAESLIDALKKADKPYQYYLLEDEGHGFYKPEHRLKYFKKVLAFLEKPMQL
ncbi:MULTISPECIES: S9 family peptidase [Pseudoalteromonas]|uniref:alpha/beta hydrolase family protein n=1 Tax=Pseudoalteromonas TaxID=53246 RepID=UPI000299FB00|nr:MULTISPECIES: S9 family peptidase [Pseudoalteromonas]AUJ71628.1 Prolyl tripeptidyl peptidase precursor [Pseudoalteromonas sp. NC201]MBR8845489.1 S9 family peptidase [Pseudoalteromonas sp. JC3]MCF2828413.1 S9 family peptidase [Pseudoalteromonas sp. OF5H-5]MCF2833895.1 S9 family peptidase [Pseudoalteromonas sp. DL2-H6]MCF2924501.1 S9 family peptidase [Pseudoalteromonas sp. DL2-H1]